MILLIILTKWSGYTIFVTKRNDSELIRIEIVIICNTYKHKEKRLQI